MLTLVGGGVEPDPHVPKPAWHPVPQYPLVDPHQPLLEQQVPKVEPVQVKPVVPPQVASLDGVKVGGVVLPQVPKAGLQPAPQYAAVEPLTGVLLVSVTSSLLSWQIYQ